MRHLRGAATVCLLLGNLALWGIPISLLGIVKRVLPGGPLRHAVSRMLVALADKWVGGNDRIFDLRLDTVWDVEGIAGLKYDGRYLITSNHVSWVDIVALQRVFRHHVAFLRFFLKQELIWFPIIGQACWAVDFPFMKRYSAEYLEKHPEKRGTDLETTRRACAKFRYIPVAILNFLEGTRFTKEKHAEQKSPYRHLLRPRTGGIAFVIASLGDQLDAVIDVTLAYPGGDVNMWDFITNRVPRVTIRAKRLDISPEFRTAAIAEPGPEREHFKAWLQSVWQAKDEELDALLALPAVESPARRKSESG
jgi:1-acyl-sn-glycerol-3-phosphate acyltransferase